MKSNSLKQQIMQMLRRRRVYINGAEIERMALYGNYKSSNASRRCRELCEDGLIERKLEKSKKGKVATVWYRA